MHQCARLRRKPPPNIQPGGLEPDCIARTAGKARDHSAGSLQFPGRNRVLQRNRPVADLQTLHSICSEAAVQRCQRSLVDTHLKRPERGRSRLPFGDATLAARPLQGLLVGHADSDGAHGNRIGTPLDPGAISPRRYRKEDTGSCLDSCRRSPTSRVRDRVG